MSQGDKTSHITSMLSLTGHNYSHALCWHGITPGYQGLISAEGIAEPLRANLCTLNSRHHRMKKGSAWCLPVCSRPRAVPPYLLSACHLTHTYTTSSLPGSPSHPRLEEGMHKGPDSCLPATWSFTLVQRECIVIG